MARPPTGPLGGFDPQAWLALASSSPAAIAGTVISVVLVVAVGSAVLTGGGDDQGSGLQLSAGPSSGPATAATAAPGATSTAPPAPTPPDGTPISLDDLPAFLELSGVYLGPPVPRGIVDLGVRIEDWARGLCRKIGARTSCTLNAWDILDWLELESTGAFRTSRDGDIRVDFTGVLHHVQGYTATGPPYFPPGARRASGNWTVTRCHLQQQVYDLEGFLTFDSSENTLNYTFTGTLRGTPTYSAGTRIQLLRNTGIGVVYSSGIYDEGAVEYDRRAFPVPEIFSGFTFYPTFFELVDGTAGDQPEGCRRSTESRAIKLLSGGTKADVTAPITGSVFTTGGGQPTRGTVTLFRENGENGDADPTEIATTPLGDGGYFTFAEVPFFILDGEGEAERAIYTIEITEGTGEISPPFFGSNVMYYSPVQLSGVRAMDVVRMHMQSLPEVGFKLRLVEQLSELSPNQFKDAEAPVPGFLDRVLEDGVDPVELEALRRGIWAENVIKEASVSGKDLTKQFVGNIADLLANLYDDFADAERDDIKAAKDRKNRFAGSSDPLTQEWQDYAKGVNLSATSPIDAARNLERINKRATVSSMAGKIKKGMKIGAAALQGVLIKTFGVDTGTAGKVASALEYTMKVILSATANQSVRGTLHNPIQDVIKFVVGLAEPLLYDGKFDLKLPKVGSVWEGNSANFPSFTRSLRPFLDDAVGDMQAWQTSNPDAYAIDSAKAATAVNDIANSWVSTQQRLIDAKAIAATAEVLADFAELGEDLHPWIKKAKLLLKVIQYLGLTSAVIDPAIFLYYTAPDVAERGVANAFGKEPPGEGSASVVRAGATARLVARAPSTIATADALTRIETALAANDLGGALQAGTAGSGSYGAERDSFDRELETLYAQATGAGDAALAGAVGTAIFDALAADVAVAGGARRFEREFADFFADVLDLRYPNTSAADYIAARDRLIAMSVALRGGLGDLDGRSSALGSSIDGLQVLAAIVADELIATSEATGEEEITETVERFAVTATLRNAGPVAAGDVAVRLLIDSPRGSLQVEESIVVVGTIGAGGEVEVSWTVRYEGDLASEEILLTAVVLEGESVPLSFVAIDGDGLLRVASELSDADGDGVPDDWERAHGLDPRSDDAGEDPDEDGLTNIEEYNLGTDPQDADTDGDGIDDGAELNPESGLPSSPLRADSDGDGVTDDLDRNPTDPDLP